MRKSISSTQTRTFGQHAMLWECAGLAVASRVYRDTSKGGRSSTNGGGSNSSNLFTKS